LAATVITISRKIQRIIQQDRNSRLGGLCKKLDMGKGCVRFKSLEDLALDVWFAGRELYGTERG